MNVLFLSQVRSSDIEKMPQPSPEMTSQRRSVDHFGLRGSGSDTKLSGITASPATVSQYMWLCIWHVYIHIHLCTLRYILFVHYDKVLTGKCIFFCTLFVQVHRLRSSRSSGSSGFGFSSHSHAKFVSQLMRESRLRVSVVVCTTLLLVLVWQA